MTEMFLLAGNGRWNAGTEHGSRVNTAEQSAFNSNFDGQNFEIILCEMSNFKFFVLF